MSVNVDFGDNSASQLTIAQAYLVYAGTIYGVGESNTIAINQPSYIDNYAPDGIAFANGVLTAYQGTSAVLEISFSGRYTAANFSISDDDIISFVRNVPCFASGTMISGPHGRLPCRTSVRVTSCSTQVMNYVRLFERAVAS